MFKKKIVAIALSIAAVLQITTVFSADTNKVKMVVDDSNIVRTIGPEMYGVNMEWGVGIRGYSQLQDENGNVVMNETFPETYGDLFQFVRKAGTSGNYFLWKDALGPISERKQQKIWGSSGIVYEGLVEWLEILYSGTESPKIDYVVNIYTDTYENIADLVEFLVGDGKINYNGGENWAEYRMKLGFEKPVDVFAWEIGNELDWSDNKIPLETYIERAKNAIDIIRSIDSDAKICLHTATNLWNGSDGSQNWHRGFLKELGNEIDLVSVHYYYPANFVTRADPPIEALKNDILEITGSDRIKLYYSEQAPARTAEKFTKDDNYEYCLPHTIWGATAEAEFYLRKWLDPWVVASTCHSIDSANWSISYNDENNECKLTAVGETMKTFNKYGVGNIYESTLDTFNADSQSLIAGGVVEDENGNVNILFTNRNEIDNVTVDFEFKENLYKIKHVRKVHGDVKKADNWYRAGESWKYDNPYRVEITDEDVTSSEYFTSFTFEPLSVYAVQLEKIQVENKDELISSHINNCFAFGFDYSNVLNKGSVIQSYSNGFVTPVLYDGSTYVKADELSDVLGNEVRISNDGKIVNVAGLGNNIEFNIENNTVNVDNIPSAKLINGNVYLPLRALVEKMGYSVIWDERNFMFVYKNGTLTIPKSTMVRNAIYQKLIGG